MSPNRTLLPEAAEEMGIVAVGRERHARPCGALMAMAKYDTATAAEQVKILEIGSGDLA